jgi:ATP-dependent Lhr-like helicase
VQDGINTFVFTWASDWINDTLALMLGQQGCRALNEGLCLTVVDVPEENLRAALSDIANQSGVVGTELVANVQNKEREKWDHLLPPELLSKGFAARELDIPGAVEIALKLSK